MAPSAPGSRRCGRKVRAVRLKRDFTPHLYGKPMMSQINTIIFALMFIAAALAGDDNAHARPIGDWPCPESHIGKWHAFSGGAEAILGDMEVRKDSLVFSLHGEIPFNLRLIPKEGNENRAFEDKRYYVYYELLKPFSEDIPIQSNVKYMAFHMPMRGFRGITHPNYQCLMEVVSCETLEEMTEDLLSNGERGGCDMNSFLPLGHYQELIAE